MKLWHIAQWGNYTDGGNGADTNCIIRANDLQSAIVLGEKVFSSQYRPLWREGKADTIILMGEDSSDSTEEKVVIETWIAQVFNHPNYKSWGRDYQTNEWISHDILYPPGT